jgi:chaperonin cofactor prefoldin
VLKHDHFEEICAAASIGQATPEELADLERHAAECDSCRDSYHAYLNVAAEQFAAAADDSALSTGEAFEYFSSERLTRRFLDRAKREGIAFSPEAREDLMKRQSLPLSAQRPSWTKIIQAIAAMFLIAVAVRAGYFYGRRSPEHQTNSATPTDQLLAVQPTIVAKTNKQLDSELERRVAALQSENRGLQTRIEKLTSALRTVNTQLATKQADVEVASRDREDLSSKRETLEGQLRDLRQQLASSDAATANAQQEIARLRERSGDIEASLVADRARIRDLTEQLVGKTNALDQEHQLLAVGHDVTDLMGARNLHIVDVVDTDSRGNTRPAFGRIFFTEGKSLIFYAYDLNEAKIEKANYQYRIWAKKEAGDKQVRNLGVFYSDNKAQKRWAFKCTDQKILNEIDSVFVTLEPAGSDPTRPKGQNLMYAYLRGQANHP